MAKILLKDAVKAWKKAKPLTLTKTGISEALRPLQTYNPPRIGDADDWIKELEKCKQVLDVASRNKHIVAQKKAHECVKDILTEVNDQLDKLKDWKEEMNKALKKVAKEGADFIDAPAESALRDITASVQAINKLLEPFFTSKIEVAQVPTRIELCAKNLLNVMKKDVKNIPNALKELEGQVKKCEGLKV